MPRIGLVIREGHVKKMKAGVVSLIFFLTGSYLGLHVLVLGSESVFLVF